MEGSPLYLIGIDWASDKHDVCVLDPAGTIEAHFVISHTADGLADLLRQLRRFGDPQRLAIAIERPSGLLGCDHPHAVRILARAWVRVLWRCWQSCTPYDINKHGRALPFLNSPPQPHSPAA